MGASATARVPSARPNSPPVSVTRSPYRSVATPNGSSDAAYPTVRAVITNPTSTPDSANAFRNSGVPAYTA